MKDTAFSPPGAAFFTAVSLVFRHHLLAASGATGAIMTPALEYFTITAGASILMFLLFSVFFAFNSQGDNKTITLLFSISTVVNAVLDPALIFGWGALPAMGIRGAAYATVFSQLLVLISALIILRKANMMVGFRFSRLGMRWASVKKVLDIGFPAALTNVVGPLSLAALTAIISSRFHEAGAISFSIGFRVEFFAYLPAVGFGVAALALLGQNAGARRFDRVRSAYRSSLLIAFASATALGLLAALLRNPAIGLFTSDPLVSEYSRAYFLTVPFSYGLFAMVFVEINSLQGIGRSWTGFLLSLARICLAIPAAYLLLSVLRLPLFTGWLAIVAANALMAAAGLRWVQGSLRNLETQPPAWSLSPELPAIGAKAAYRGAGTELSPEPAAGEARFRRPRSS